MRACVHVLSLARMDEACVRVSDIIADTIYYYNRLPRKRETPRWNSVNTEHRGILPIPTETRKARKKAPPTVGGANLPPSIRNMYMQLRSSDMFVVPGPFFDVSPELKFSQRGNAWDRLLTSITQQSITEEQQQEQQRKLSLSIPMSPVEHDNEQLRIGRVSAKTKEPLPLCTYGKYCSALNIQGNTTPLHVYVTPAQAMDVDTKGTLFTGPCLLCIRKNITMVAIAYNSKCMRAGAHNRITVQTPFYNLCEASGGYNRDDMIFPNELIFLSGPVAKYALDKLEFVPTKVSELGVEEGFINQGSMVWQNAASKQHLN